MKTEYCIGIDIGSTCAKTVVLSRDKRVLLQLLQPTGWSSVDTAEDIRRRLEELGLPVVTGEFGAEMQVLVENDGPITLMLDTEKL